MNHADRTVAESSGAVHVGASADMNSRAASIGIILRLRVRMR
jgi:hypothetical protein